MTDEATTKRLKEALMCSKKAARSIAASFDVWTGQIIDEARYTYYRNDAIAQLEFALTALRAAK